MHELVVLGLQQQLLLRCSGWKFTKQGSALHVGRAALQSLVATDNFQHILRVLNTNVDGKQNIMYAMTAIKGIGRRFSNIVCKKAEVDLRKR